MKENKNLTLCSIDYAFKRLGGKFKGRIIWALYHHGVLRYGELKKSMNDINTKTLTLSLKEMEDDNLIERTVYPEVPPKVEYKLTDGGKRMAPFILYMKEWGEEQIERITHKKTAKLQSLFIFISIIRSQYRFQHCCHPVLRKIICRQVLSLIITFPEIQFL
jgi:DNA-binding HxlR family transcriptional regulator